MPRKKTGKKTSRAVASYTEREAELARYAGFKVAKEKPKKYNYDLTEEGYRSFVSDWNDFVRRLKSSAKEGEKMKEASKNRGKKKASIEEKFAKINGRG